MIYLFFSHRHNGFSLLELCTAILIIAILLSAGLPYYHQFLMRIEREMILDRLKTAIEMARQEALIQEKTMTLCASADQKTCQALDWSAGFILFENASFAPHPLAPQILQVFPKLKYGKLHFDQFGKNLNIQADGTTFNAGTFTYCPKNGERREADGLIINLMGRTYRPIERNSQGILLKNAGTPLATPLTCR